MDIYLNYIYFYLFQINHYFFLKSRLFLVKMLVYLTRELCSYILIKKEHLKSVIKEKMFNEEIIQHIRHTLL